MAGSYLRPEEAILIPFSPSLPDVTKCETIKAYRVGDNIALLVKGPKPLGAAHGIDLGLVEYLYALTVVTNEGDVVLIVTAERSGEKLRALTKDSSSEKQTDDSFLCVFDQSGIHSNLDSSPEFANIDKFVTHALKVACELLNISAAPIELRPKKSITSKRGVGREDTGLQPLSFFLAAMVLLALAMYPPWEFKATGIFAGFHFIFSPGVSVYAKVDTGLLILEWIAMLAVVYGWYRVSRAKRAVAGGAPLDAKSETRIGSVNDTDSTALGSHDRKDQESLDDFRLASKIASAIDWLVKEEGVDTLKDGDWSVVLTNDSGIALSRELHSQAPGGGTNARTAVKLGDLPETAMFTRIRGDQAMGDSPIGYMATDRLAMAVLREMKKRLSTTVNDARKRHRNNLE